MEVKLDKRDPLAASTEQAWRLLADVRATAACMPGAQITEPISENHFKGTVKSKIGPAAMLFHGEIEVLALDPATRTLKMLGKGADKAGSSAQLVLTARIEPDPAQPAGSTLVGQATITVGGKLVQFGSRLLVPVSDAILAQFADNFRVAAAALPAATPFTSATPATAFEPAPAPAASSPTTAAAAAASPSPSAPPLAPTPPHRELNALSLLWTALKPQVAGWFGKRR
jgi:carbon monoxide dehydrogenase subunit G